MLRSGTENLTDAQTLCAKVLETPTPFEFTVEGGEA
jgi:hypothetical protein